MQCPVSEPYQCKCRAGIKLQVSCRHCYIGTLLINKQTQCLTLLKSDLVARQTSGLRFTNTHASHHRVCPMARLAIIHASSLSLSSSSSLSRLYNGQCWLSAHHTCFLLISIIITAYRALNGQECLSSVYWITITITIFFTITIIITFGVTGV